MNTKYMVQRALAYPADRVLLVFHNHRAACDAMELTHMLMRGTREPAQFRWASMTVYRAIEYGGTITFVSGDVGEKFKGLHVDRAWMNDLVDPKVTAELHNIIR